MSRDDLLKLAEHCEKAEEPDRQIDEAIRLLVGRNEVVVLDLAGGYVPPSTPAYTASLDAAITLVPEGWHVGDLAENWKAPGWRTTVAERPTEGQRRAYDSGGQFMVQSECGEAATAALALVAAALRARAAMEGQSQ